MSLRKLVAITLSVNEEKAIGHWLQAEFQWADALDRDALAYTRGVLEKLRRAYAANPTPPSDVHYDPSSVR